MQRQRSLEAVANGYLPVQVDPPQVENAVTDKIYTFELPSIGGCWVTVDDSIECYSHKAIGKRRCKWSFPHTAERLSGEDNCYTLQLELARNDGEVLKDCQLCRAWREKTQKPLFVITPNGSRGMQFTQHPSFKVIFRCTPKAHESKIYLDLTVTLRNFSGTKKFSQEVRVAYKQKKKMALMNSIKNKRDRPPSMDRNSAEPPITRKNWVSLPDVPVPLARSLPSAGFPLDSRSEGDAIDVDNWINSSPPYLGSDSSYKEEEEEEGMRQRSMDDVLSTPISPTFSAQALFTVESKEEEGPNVAFDLRKELSRTWTYPPFADGPKVEKKRGERSLALSFQKLMSREQAESNIFISERSKMIDEFKEDIRISLLQPAKQFIMHVTLKTDSNPHVLIFSAFKTGHTELGEKLFEKFKDSFDLNQKNSIGFTLLHAAASCGDYKGVKWCMEHGSKIAATTNNGYTALHFAYMRNDKDIIKLLEDEGGVAALQHQVDNFGMIPAEYDNTCIRTQPLQSVAPIANAVQIQLVGWSDCVFCMDIWHACRVGFKDAVELYVERVECPTEVKNSLGQTPLMAACEHQRLEIVEYLLSKGANINATDIFNITPLHYAHMSGNITLITIFQDKGADATRRDYWGRTPRQYFPKPSSHFQPESCLSQLFQDQLTLQEISPKP